MAEGRIVDSLADIKAKIEAFDRECGGMIVVHKTSSSETRTTLREWVIVPLREYIAGIESMDMRWAAKILSSRGGKKGGIARAAALSPERRREIAIKAARARWDNKSKEAD